MKIFEQEMSVFFDVDETLIKNMFHNITGGSPIRREVIDPYTKDKRTIEGFMRHIDLLKTMKARGYAVIVWSGGGVLWAETVIKALGLEEYVDLVMSKPQKYVDDLDANEFMNRIYLG